MGISLADAELMARKAQTVTFYEATAWPDGKRAVAFLNMGTRLVDAAEWATLKVANALP
jgi:hypothetical protein